MFFVHVKQCNCGIVPRHCCCHLVRGQRVRSDARTELPQRTAAGPPAPPGHASDLVRSLCVVPSRFVPFASSSVHLALSLSSPGNKFCPPLFIFSSKFDDVKWAEKGSTTIRPSPRKVQFRFSTVGGRATASQPIVMRRHR